MTGAILRAALTATVAMMLGVASVAVWANGDPPPPAPGTQFDGAALFRSKGCVGCHTGPDADSLTNVGPNLRLLADVAAERKPGLSAQQYVRESVLSPQEFIAPGFAGGVAMPTLQVSPEELNAIVSYLVGE
jgi:cytochrome c551/c552